MDTMQIVIEQAFVWVMAMKKLDQKLIQIKTTEESGPAKCNPGSCPFTLGQSLDLPLA